MAIITGSLPILQPSGAKDLTTPDNWMGFAGTFNSVPVFTSTQTATGSTPSSSDPVPIFRGLVGANYVTSVGSPPVGATFVTIIGFE